MVLDANNFHKEVDRATEKIKSFGKTAASVGAGLVGAGGLLGGLGSIEAAGRAFESFVEHGFESVRSQVELSKKLGESVEGLSQLSHAAVMSNVSTEKLEAGLLRLQRSLGGAESEITRNAVAFERWGLDAHALADLSLPDAFEKISDRFKELRTTGEQAALAFSLFGKRGQELIPLLRQGHDGISAFRAEADRLGITITEEGAKKFEAYERASKQLNEAWTSLARTAAIELSPALSKLSQGGTGILQSDFVRGLLGLSPRRQEAAAGDGNRKENNAIGRIEDFRTQFGLIAQKQLDVASGIDEWSRKFEDVYNSAWRLAVQMDRIKAGSGDELVAQAEKLKENFEAAKEAIKEAQQLEKDTKADEARRNQDRVKQEQARADQIKHISELEDEVGGKAKKLMDGIANIRQLEGLGLSKKAANQGIADLLKGLGFGGTDTAKMAAANAPNSAEEIHLQNLDRMQESANDLQQQMVNFLQQINAGEIQRMKMADEINRNLKFLMDNIGVVG